MRETHDPEILPIAEYVRERINVEPVVALVTGSGLAAVVESVEDAIEIPTNEIPGFPPSTVQGHPGKLLSGTLASVPVIVAQGRIHAYEGYSFDKVVVPTRLFAALGVKAALLSTATGAINDSLNPGDLVCIRDHINLMGGNPLVRQQWGFDTFCDMSNAYHPGIRELLWQAARNQGLSLREGVFVGVLGPSYETPAEISFMRRIGGDIVSMSTVPEVIAASRLKMPIAAVGYVSNMASGLSAVPLSHEEVSEMGAKVSEQYQKLFKAVLPLIANAEL